LPSDCRVIFVGVFLRLADNRFHVRPVAAGIEDHQLVSAASLAEFGGVGGGRHADGFFVDQRAALRLPAEAIGGKLRVIHNKKRGGEQNESQFHT
jgi:hypothetical protein